VLSFVPLHLVKIKLLDSNFDLALNVDSKVLSAGLETLSVDGSGRIAC
jgi:hypothetical protein